jgi:hypothetical protein
MLFGLSLLALVAAVFFALPVFRARFDTSVLSGARAVQEWSFMGQRLSSPRLAVAGGLLAALFSSIALAYVLVSFRKTASPEIFFFAFWVLSIGFEAGRILVLRLAVEGYSGTWVSFATRAVYASRFAGYMAFFLSGLHASGFRSERLGRSIASVAALGLAFASALPLDTGSFDPTLLVRPGYARVEGLLVLALAVVSVVDFFLGAGLKGEPRFRVAAIGAVLMLAGQYLLVGQWRPELVIIALALLATGTRLFVSRLHAYYLWQ